MAEAIKDVHSLPPRGGLEQSPALRERHDVVTVAVEDQERSVKLVDPSQGGVDVGDESRGDERVVQTAEIADASESRDGNDGRGGDYPARDDY